MHKLIGAASVLALLCVDNTQASSCHGGGSVSHPGHKRHREAEREVGGPRTQTLCPVTKERTQSALYIDWEGDHRNTPKRIYVCCESCKEKVGKRPARHVRKLRKLGQPIENLLQGSAQE